MIMDKRMKGDGTVRKVLVSMPAALHRKVKAAAAQADKTLDEVLVGIIEAGVGRERRSASTHPVPQETR
jgi:hypothetical protein